MLCLNSLVIKLTNSIINYVSTKIEYLNLKMDETLLGIRITETKMEYLPKRLNDLEAKFAVIEISTVDKNSDLKAVSRDYLVELEKKTSRKKNLVLFGILETVNSGKQVDDNKFCWIILILIGWDRFSKVKTNLGLLK